MNERKPTATTQNVTLTPELREAILTAIRNVKWEEPTKQFGLGAAEERYAWERVDWRVDDCLAEVEALLTPKDTGTDG